MRPFIVYALLALVSLCGLPVATSFAAAPEVFDPAYELSLFAQAPDIVTPTGLVTDDRGRVFVIESHTHMPPPEYRGPTHDRIKIFSDTNGDGRGELVSVFADGPFRDAMNLVFVKPGEFILVTRDAVLALFDRDGDDHAETQTTILRLESPNRYPHSGLLGAALSPEGEIYVSRGNIGGAPYTYLGNDGRRLSGMGTGGDIVRIRRDGSGLTLIATGFWNPFGLQFDQAGRLWATDNDPNSRGPNRLLHIVPGGDYGFSARYGNSGLHPHVAWNGELPGTLGYVGGTGESPGGLITPSAREIWVASWADKRIERFSLLNHGATFRSTRQTLIGGDEQFRPVGLAQTRTGDVFISDWVLAQYPNHGEGRLWRLSRKQAHGKFTQVKDLRAIDSELKELLARAETVLRWRRFACTNDETLRAAFVFRLSADMPSILKLQPSPKACERLSALAALRWRALSGEQVAFAARTWLADADVDVRRLALRWVAEGLDPAHQPWLRQAIMQPSVTPELVRAYLATLQLFSAPPPKAWTGAWPDNAQHATPEAIESLVKDPALPEDVRALSLLLLAKPTPAQVPWLVSLVLGRSPRMRLPALLALQDVKVQPTFLLDVARNLDAEPQLRMTAISQLADSREALPQLLPLLSDIDPNVQLLAARSLRLIATQPAVAAALRQRQAKPMSAGLAAAIAFALSPSTTLEAREKDSAAFNKSLAEGGDPLLGQFVFRHPGVGCARCHSIGGRGGRLGPPLDQIGLAVDRARLTESVLHPSAELSPEFQVYVVTLSDGTVLEGTQLHWDATGKVATLELQTGERRTLRTIKRVDTPTSSFMPEGLSDLMTTQELQDLLAYLQQRGRTSELSTEAQIFDGSTLHGWVGRPDLWRVERTAGTPSIVGSVQGDLPHNEFLIYPMAVGDFRLQLEVKLESAGNNSGIQFRSERIQYEDGHDGVRGYQADVGGPDQAYWGRIYHERGRQWLWQQSLAPGVVKGGQFNRYEILAIGDRIITAVNGHVAACILDPKGEKRGFIALQLHGGIPAKVAFRNLSLDRAPTSNLLTTQRLPESCVTLR